MKYANLIAATHFSSVGAAAFSEDSAFKDCQFVARHLHSAVPLAPPAVFFFIIIIYEQRRFHEMLDSAGSRGFRCDFLLLCLLLSKPAPNKMSFCLSFFLLFSSQRRRKCWSRRLCRASCPACCASSAEASTCCEASTPSRASCRSDTLKKERKKIMKKLFRHLSQESLSAARRALCLHKLSLSAPLSE